MDNHPYSSLAQSVERMTVNHDVVGSSPTGGAKQRASLRRGSFFGSFSPAGLNQTTSRFENVTRAALLTERKRFQDAIGTPGAPFHFRFSPGRPAQIIDVVGAWLFALQGGEKRGVKYCNFTKVDFYDTIC